MQCAFVTAVPEAPPNPPLSSVVANALALFSAAVGGAATAGGGAAGHWRIASPEVKQEVGHIKPVLDFSGGDSDGVELLESDECHDNDRDWDASSGGCWIGAGETDTGKKEIARR